MELFCVDALQTVQETQTYKDLFEELSQFKGPASIPDLIFGLLMFTSVWTEAMVPYVAAL